MTNNDLFSIVASIWPILATGVLLGTQNDGKQKNEKNMLLLS
jgi:hypothetical protein